MASREEMMGQLNAQRQFANDLQNLLDSISEVTDAGPKITTLRDKYRQESHDLANRIQVLDVKRLGLVSDNDR